MPEVKPMPGVIKILGEGCNLTANKVHLMLLPLVLDLFLLFGPRLRISEYFLPAFEAAYNQMVSSYSGTLVSQLELSLGLIAELLSSLNLFGLLQTFPIGVNVINGSAGNLTPIGKASEIQLTSVLQMIPLIGLFLICGVIIGTVYFALSARAAKGENEKYTFSLFGKQLINVILLYFALTAALLILAIPMTCLMTFAFMISSVVYQLIMFVIMVFVCWLIVPLFYTPHGIFMKGLDFPHALKESFQMASWSGSLTIRFLLLALVISMGLDMIWAIPQQNSWLILFSIFGHAFVSTALLVSSFIMYRELNQWQQENQSFIDWRKNNIRIKQLFKKEAENHD